MMVGGRRAVALGVWCLVGVMLAGVSAVAQNGWVQEGCDARATFCSPCIGPSQPSVYRVMGGAPLMRSMVDAAPTDVPPVRVLRIAGDGTIYAVAQIDITQPGDGLPGEGAGGNHEGRVSVDPAAKPATPLPETPTRADFRAAVVRFPATSGTASAAELVRPAIVFVPPVERDIKPDIYDLLISPGDPGELWVVTQTGVHHGRRNGAAWEFTNVGHPGGIPRCAVDADGWFVAIGTRGLFAADGRGKLDQPTPISLRMSPGEAFPAPTWRPAFDSGPDAPAILWLYNSYLYVHNPNIGKTDRIYVGPAQGPPQFLQVYPPPAGKQQPQYNVLAPVRIDTDSGGRGAITMRRLCYRRDKPFWTGYVEEWHELGLECRGVAAGPGDAVYAIWCPVRGERDVLKLYALQLDPAGVSRDSSRFPGELAWPVLSVFPADGGRSCTSAAFRGLFSDAAGRVYVGFGDRIVAYDLDGTKLWGWQLAGEGIPEQATLCAPPVMGPAGEIVAALSSGQIVVSGPGQSRYAVTGRVAVPADVREQVEVVLGSGRTTNVEADGTFDFGVLDRSETVTPRLAGWDFTPWSLDSACAAAQKLQFVGCPTPPDPRRPSPGIKPAPASTSWQISCGFLFGGDVGKQVKFGPFGASAARIGAMIETGTDLNLVLDTDADGKQTLRVDTTHSDGVGLRGSLGPEVGANVVDFKAVNLGAEVKVGLGTNAVFAFDHVLPEQGAINAREQQITLALIFGALAASAVKAFPGTGPLVAGLTSGLSELIGGPYTETWGPRAELSGTLSTALGQVNLYHNQSTKSGACLQLVSGSLTGALELGFDGYRPAAGPEAPAWAMQATCTLQPDIALLTRNMHGESAKGEWDAGIGQLLPMPCLNGTGSITARHEFDADNQMRTYRLGVSVETQPPCALFTAKTDASELELSLDAAEIRALLAHAAQQQRGQRLASTVLDFADRGNALAIKDWQGLAGDLARILAEAFRQCRETGATVGSLRKSRARGQGYAGQLEVGVAVGLGVFVGGDVSYLRTYSHDVMEGRIGFGPMWSRNYGGYAQPEDRREFSRLVKDIMVSAWDTWLADLVAKQFAVQRDTLQQGRKRLLGQTREEARRLATARIEAGPRALATVAAPTRWEGAVLEMDSYEPSLTAPAPAGTPPSARRLTRTYRYPADTGPGAGSGVPREFVAAGLVRNVGLLDSHGTPLAGWEEAEVALRLEVTATDLSARQVSPAMLGEVCLARWDQPTRRWELIPAARPRPGVLVAHVTRPGEYMPALVLPTEDSSAPVIARGDAGASSPAHLAFTGT